MKLRRAQRLFGLSRPRVRQSWNKHNLYNLAKLSNKNFEHRTFFQRKWAAKAALRAYHGEHIKERQWERMFSRKLPAVVTMDPIYMAQNDGSEQASGRGSGQQERGSPDETKTNRKHPELTPYMQMTFAPMERRLDIAIFRAMFASSARQARQLVTHGYVQVNGSPMKFPGYLLNPGDMFQVEPDRVMIATGRQRGPARVKTPRPKRDAAEDGEEAATENSEESTKGEGEEVTESTGEAAEGTPDAAKDGSVEATAVEASDEDAIIRRNSKILQGMLKRAKAILAMDKPGMGAKQKQLIRSFTRDTKAAISRAGQRSATAEQTTLSVEELNKFLKTLTLSTDKSSLDASSALTAPAANATSPSSPYGPRLAWNALSADESKIFRQRFEAYSTNPDTRDKPYFTPWQPHKYMSAFAFIPRYLEVNQNVCAAVYLRHPVARPGESEVPSPFGEDLTQLAFNWYLRRR